MSSRRHCCALGSLNSPRSPVKSTSDAAPAAVGQIYSRMKHERTSQFSLKAKQYARVPSVHRHYARAPSKAQLTIQRQRSLSIWMQSWVQQIPKNLHTSRFSVWNPSDDFLQYITPLWSCFLAFRKFTDHRNFRPCRFKSQSIEPQNDNASFSTLSKVMQRCAGTFFSVSSCPIPELSDIGHLGSGTGTSFEHQLPGIIDVR